MSSLSSHEHWWEFSTDQIQQLNQHLASYLSNTRSKLAMLADTNGHLIVYKGRGESAKVIMLSNLAAAGFAASTEIDNYIDCAAKSNLQHLLLEGEHASIYISSIVDDLLFITAFESPTTIASVRIYSCYVCKCVKDIYLEVVSDPANQLDASKVQVDAEFGEEVDNQLNYLLGNDTGI